MRTRNKLAWVGVLVSAAGLGATLFVAYADTTWLSPEAEKAIAVVGLSLAALGTLGLLALFISLLTLRDGMEDSGASVEIDGSTRSQAMEASPGSVQIGRDLVLAGQSPVDHRKILIRAYRRAITAVETASGTSSYEAIMTAKQDCLAALDEIEDAAENALPASPTELQSIIAHLHRSSRRGNTFPGQSFTAGMEDLGAILNEALGVPLREEDDARDDIIDVLAEAEELKEDELFKQCMDAFVKEVSKMNRLLTQAARDLSSQPSPKIMRAKSLRYQHLVEDHARSYVEAADAMAKQLDHRLELLQATAKTIDGSPANEKVRQQLAELKLNLLGRKEFIDTELDRHVATYRWWQKRSQAFRRPLGPVIRSTKRCIETLRTARDTILSTTAEPDDE